MKPGATRPTTSPRGATCFPADQMPLHMSTNEFGASYSFFLPWDEAGGPKTEVSLICRFEPVGGSVITGEQTRHMLPGVMPAIAADGAHETAEGAGGCSLEARHSDAAKLANQTHGGTQRAIGQL